MKYEYSGYRNEKENLFFFHFSGNLIFFSVMRVLKLDVDKVYKKKKNQTTKKNGKNNPKYKCLGRWSDTASFLAHPAELSP